VSVALFNIYNKKYNKKIYTTVSNIKYRNKKKEKEKERNTSKEIEREREREVR
jgi:hypothetical protein